MESSLAHTLFNSTMATQEDNRYSTIIVGAGIVGSAIAAFLSEDNPTDHILLIDRSFDDVNGSTGYAPGFLGQFNESDVLTRLAVDSLKEYERFPDIFKRAGGFEFACSEQGIDQLSERCKRANARDVEARVLSAGEAAFVVPTFVDKRSYKQVLHFPRDGVADPRALCLRYRALARRNGVETLEASVDSFEIVDGVTSGVRTVDGRILRADRVIVATGIWTSLLAKSATQTPVPVVPVAHPYVYTAEQQEDTQTPFCRWPEDHVYARFHGHRFGLGSYDHPPVHVESPNATASEPWPSATFGPVIAKAARSKISPGAELAKLASLDSEAPNSGLKPINGVFSVTPDNLPLLGPVPGVEGLWLAAAIWITHAAGAARLLLRMMSGESYDREMAHTLDPARFAEGDAYALQETALRQYNDIYRSELAVSSTAI
jgi:glycine/D-amino acid oxidase-like deaminating enzyme